MEGLEYLEMHLSDVCNLKCKGCSHFSNIAEDSSVETILKFEQHMERLASILPMIYKIRLLGGEPLLNKQAKDYIMCVRKYYPYTDISLVTNGLLLLKQDDELFNTLRKCNIGLDISLYPPTMKILDRIEVDLKSKNIAYTLTEPIRCFRRRMNRNGTSDPIKAHQSCISRHCHFYSDGKLSACPAPIVIQHLVNKFGFEYIQNTGDVLSIDEDGIDDRKIIEFLNQPMDICRYCSEPEEFEWSCTEKASLSDWFVID